MTDAQIVEMLVSNDQHFADAFFKKNCRPLLNKLNWKIFNNKMKPDIMGEYLKFYLQQNNWHRLKSFKGESSLTWWLAVTASRYFYSNRHLLMPDFDKPARTVPKRNRFNFDEASEEDINYILDRMDDPLLSEFIRLRHVEKLKDDDIVDGVLSGSDVKFKEMERDAYKRLEKVLKEEGERYEELFIKPAAKGIEVGDGTIPVDPPVNEQPRTIAKIDVENVLSKLTPTEQYLVRNLILEDRKRDIVAKEMGYTIKYLDTLRNRTLKKMKKLLD